MEMQRQSEQPPMAPHRMNTVDPAVLEHLQRVEDNDAKLREQIPAAHALMLLHKEASAIVALQEVRKEKQKERERPPTTGRKLVENAHIIVGQTSLTAMYGVEPADEETEDEADADAISRSQTLSVEYDQRLRANGAVPRASERQQVSFESNLPASTQMYAPDGRGSSDERSQVRRNEAIQECREKFYARENAPVRSTRGGRSRRSQPAETPQASSRGTTIRLPKRSREVLAAMGDDNDDEIEAAKDRVKSRKRRRSKMTA